MSATRESILRSLWTVNESTKDEVERTIVQAVQTKRIRVEDAELPKLLSLVKATIDASYQRAAPNIERTIDAEVITLLSDVSVPKSAGPQKKPAAKKV